jgi:acyl-CoA thioester hydrolase
MIGPELEEWRQPGVVWYEERLRYGDLDALGHVNNAVYSTFSESGRIAFLRDRLIAPQEGGHAFVVARLSIDFVAELHYPGTVRIATRVSRMGRSSITFRQVMLAGGSLVARAESTCVLIDRDTRRSTPFPDAMREGLIGDNVTVAV